MPSLVTLAEDARGGLGHLSVSPETLVRQMRHDWLGCSLPAILSARQRHDHSHSHPLPQVIAGLSAGAIAVVCLSSGEDEASGVRAAGQPPPPTSAGTDIFPVWRLFFFPKCDCDGLSPMTRSRRRP